MNDADATLSNRLRRWLGAAAPSACAMAEADKAWVGQALAYWRILAREKLRLPDRPLPAIVTFDAACAYVAPSRPDDAAARRLAGQALASLRARRARFFTGAAAQWAPLDEIFLAMEGRGQWAIFAWHRDPRGGGFEASTRHSSESWNLPSSSPAPKGK